jgi:hypothetical protein
MGARTTLNGIYFCGALVAAAILGCATESWGVFFVSVLALSAISIHMGRIRPIRRNNRR